MISDPTTETGEDVDGGNFAPSEVALGQAGRVHIKNYERHSRSHAKTIAALHQDIIGFGRVLLTGREMYPSPKEFGYWIERRGLNTGKLAKHQTERTACMTIAHLVEDGAEIDEHDDTIVPVKLDLTGCNMTTPTDIMKWARKHHRHLFPHLPPREKTPAAQITAKVRRAVHADLEAARERITELESAIGETAPAVALFLQGTADQIAKTITTDLPYAKAQDIIFAINKRLRRKTQKPAG